MARNRRVHSGVELRIEQIDAAVRLRARSVQWDLTDRALIELDRLWPGFSPEASLIKAVAINSLYSTRILALVPLGKHIASAMKRIGLQADAIELVEALADLPTGRRNEIFAAKFAHFFIDRSRFLVMDSYVERMLKYHLDSVTHVEDKNHRYKSFLANLTELRQRSKFTGNDRDLDYYLWIAGQRREWKKKREKGKNPGINRELNDLFTQGLASADSDLLLIDGDHQPSVP